MTTFEAVIIAEGIEPADDHAEYLSAWQLLVDTGIAWTLQGWFGRTAAALIESGDINQAGQA
jgi:hypothetical protein